MARRIPGSSGKRKPAQAGYVPGLPSREALTEWIAANPGQSSKREIARAFGLKGEHRTELHALLASLSDDGLVEAKKRRFAVPGALPPVAVLDVFGRDKDGDLLARPAEWDETHGEAPVVHMKIPKFSAGATPGVGARVLAKIFPSEHGGGPAYSARVVKVFDKRREAALGVLKKLADGSWRAIPVDRRQSEFQISSSDLNDGADGDLVEIDPLGASRYGLPRGRVSLVVGSLASEKAVSMIAIHAHDLPHVFPDAVITESEAARPAALAGREDWRALPLITIDPADAKDHDDAVHAEADPDATNPGGHVLTIAIADVAHYIRAGSALDREAVKRGNSVYFPDRVIPMLPERISNDLCSLRENEDRPALAVKITIAENGAKIRHSFHRIMMRSRAKLAYPQAQAAVDGQADDKCAPLLEPVLKPLYAAYKSLKAERSRRGPLDLDLPERKILLKPDGTVDRVIIPERLDAHRLIEEFMIAANVAAAETLEAKRQKLVYRIHDAPSMAKQESLREFLATLSMSLAHGPQLRPAQFNMILSKVSGTDNETLVNEVVLRSQSQAEYSPDNIGHFGLNLRRYAHFTSPIRRYADLIVHRALIGAMALGPDGLTPAEEARLPEIAALISTAERRGMAAERDTIDRLIAEHLSSRTGESFDGRISGVTKSGLFIQLPQYGADGFVPVSTLGDDYYGLDEASHALVGSRSGAGFRLGDAVEVRIAEVLPLAGSMRFEILSQPRPLPGSTRSFNKGRKPGHRTGKPASASRHRRRS